MKSQIILYIMLFTTPAWAQTFVGTFVAVKGDVKILKAPSTSDASGPFALYEGVKYVYETAKIGKKIKPSEVVQSGADGKAKIVYPNGDNFVVGVGTTMVMPVIHEGAGEKEASLKLMFGRVRALISKTGPRNQMKVKTPTAVAGVRGTDFFTRANATEGTQITVLRGEIAMQTAAKPNVIVPIKTGFTVDANPKDVEAPKAVESTKQELMAVQGESTVKASAEEVAALPAEVKKELNQLAEKSKESVLKDIKSEDVNLYNQIIKNKKLDSEEINTVVVSTLYKAAPVEQKKLPTAAEIEAIGQDVYEKYFKKTLEQ